MKTSYFSKEYLGVFCKNIFCAITLTRLKTLFIKKTLLFSKTVDSTHTKMLKTDVKYRIAMKPSNFANE